MLLDGGLCKCRTTADCCLKDQSIMQEDRPAAEVNTIGLKLREDRPATIEEHRALREEIVRLGYQTMRRSRNCGPR